MYSLIVHFDPIASGYCPFYAQVGLKTGVNNGGLDGSVISMSTFYETL